MKKLWVILFISFLLIQGCQKKNKLKVSNWAMYIAKDTISNFEKEYNCDVIYDNYSSNEELISKLKAGADYDIVFPTDYAVKIMKKLSLLKKLDHNKLDNLKHIDTKFLNLDFDKNNDFSVPYHWGSCGIGYNSKKVDKPLSYSILWDKKFKGRIAIVEDPRFVIGMILQHLGYSPNTINPKELAKAKEKIFLLKDNTKTFFNSPSVLDTGEIDVIFSYSAGLLQFEASGKNNIKYTIPKEGTLLWFDSMCIPESSKNIELAHTFINYILRPQVISDISNEVFAANPNKDAKDFLNKELLNNTNVYLNKEMMSKADLVKDLGEDNKLYLDMWQEMRTK